MWCGVPTGIGLGHARGAAGAAHSQRDAEISDERPSIVEQDILGLDVPMDHAMPVRVIERFGGVVGDADGVVHRGLLLAIEPVAERFTLDQGHHVEDHASDFTRVVQRQDVRMLHVRRGSDLVQEPLGADNRAQLGGAGPSWRPGGRVSGRARDRRSPSHRRRVRARGGTDRQEVAGPEHDRELIEMRRPGQPVPCAELLPGAVPG